MQHDRHALMSNLAARLCGAKIVRWLLVISVGSTCVLPISAMPPVANAEVVVVWLERVKSSTLKDLSHPETVQQMMDLVADASLPWEARRQLALTLGRIGPPAARAVPLFRTLLKNDEVDRALTQQWALKALGLLGPTAVDATSDVASFALDASQSFLIRATAIETLANVGNGQDIVVRTLTQVLREEPRSGATSTQQMELQLVALESLGVLGPNATPALPELLGMLENDWPLARRSAARAIGKMGARGDIALPALSDMAALDEAGEVREAAAEALGRIGPRGVQRLGQFLKSSELPLQLLAVHGLRFSPAAGESQALLQAAVRSPTDVVASRAGAALLAGEKESTLAVERLVQLLSSSDREARRVAYEVLRDGNLERLTPFRQQLQDLAASNVAAAQTVQAASSLLRRLDER